MTLHNYEASLKIAMFDHPFYALVLAAFKVGDPENLEKLHQAWGHQGYTPHEFQMSRHVLKMDPSFEALIMAAIRQADTDNTTKLRNGWPATWEELNRRYHAPLGVLPDVDGFTTRKYYDLIHPPRPVAPPTPAEEALSYLEESEELTQEDWEELTDTLIERRSHE